MANQETILIVDNSEIYRAILRGLFEGEYNLLEAENGEQALMMMRQYRESITVVLLDLFMPEKDGYEVLQEMRQENLIFHEPVIVITAEDSTDNGLIDSMIVSMFVENYDTIMGAVRRRSQPILDKYHEMQRQYQVLERRMEDRNSQAAAGKS